MKLKNLLSGYIFFLPLIFLSCEENHTPPYLQLNLVGELPYCNTLLEDSSLIDNDEIKGIILNSDEEVHQTLTPNFLSVYPEYGKVDFNQYSILVNTSIIQGKVIGRTIKYYKSNTTPQYYCVYNYRTDMTDQNFHKERTAVIVEKLKAEETVEFINSIQPM